MGTVLETGGRMMPVHTQPQTTLDRGSSPYSMQGHAARGVGLSLLFRIGERPGAAEIARLLDPEQANGPAARISHRPDAEEGWLELLASGLTFDMRGLSPLKAVGATPWEYGGDQTFGFTDHAPEPRYEAVELAPCAHILAGAGLQPVVRTLIGLAANLALGLPVAAIHWQPADTLMEPHYFVRTVLGWLSGGAFPALGLTALTQAPDGSIVSRGLAHFTGQEMQIEGRAGESPADAINLAIRVVDELMREGKVVGPCRISAGRAVMLAEPSQVGRLVLVWRDG